MKKLTLIAAVAASLCAASAVQAQTTTTTRASTRRTTTVTSRDNARVTSQLRRIEANSQGFTTTAPRTRIDGSVTRAARSGNPLQMINPFAPKEYGDGGDVTRRESDDPYQRPQGLRLFAVEF